MFARNINLELIKKAIEGKDEFRIFERDGFIIVDYMITKEDTFHHSDPELQLVLRELRGIALSADGQKVISLGYHKFFNIGEKPETQLSKIDFNENHVVLDKLDGCCDENTLLMTSDGEKTIKEICDTEYRGMILGFDHQNNQACWSLVIDHSVKENNNDWYELEMENGQFIKLTGNHKVWVKNKSEYIKVEDLNENDEVLFVEDCK
jgi:tRNA splicing ligase